jgi:hypothetical protein
VELQPKALSLNNPSLKQGPKACVGNVTMSQEVR